MIYDDMMDLTTHMNKLNLSSSKQDSKIIKGNSKKDVRQTPQVIFLMRMS